MTSSPTTGVPERRAYARGNAESLLSTLDKGLHVLLALAAADGGYTLTELSRIVGLHRTTLFRILATLQSRNLVVRVRGSDRYTVGLGVLALAAAVLRDLDIRAVARPILEQLCGATRELVYLTVLDAGEVVTIERVEADQTLSLRNEIGSRRPAYCTASGKAILARLPPADVAVILARGMPPLTPRTMTTPAAFEAQFAEIRRRGFAWDDEERVEGVRCVAAPVFGMEGRVVGAISLAAPLVRTPWERLWHLGAQVRDAAAELSRDLGGTGAVEIEAVPQGGDAKAKEEGGCQAN